MTKQEIFNKVWDHFIVNKGKRSMSPSGKSCRYRGEDGGRCAVGILIPDEMYSSEIEGSRVHCLDINSNDIYQYLGKDNMLFLDSLQCVHDESRCWNKGVMDSKSLMLLAKTYKLTIPQTKPKETTNEKKLTIDHSNYNIPRLVLHG